MQKLQDKTKKNIYFWDKSKYLGIYVNAVYPDIRIKR